MCCAIPRKEQRKAEDKTKQKNYKKKRKEAHRPRSNSTSQQKRQRNCRLFFVGIGFIPSEIPIPHHLFTMDPIIHYYLFIPPILVWSGTFFSTASGLVLFFVRLGLVLYSTFTLI